MFTQDGQMPQILKILRDNREHALLATCDGGQPDLRTMAPFVEDDLSIWMVSRHDARKVEQLRRNPRLSLLFADIPGYAREAKVLGEARFIDDPAAKRRVWGLGTNLERYFPDGPDSPEFCLIQVMVARIEWREGFSGERHVFVPPAAS